MKQWIWVQLSAHTEAGHLAKLYHNTGVLQTQNYNECPSRPEREGGGPCAAAGRWQWADEAGSMSEGRECMDELHSGPWALWFSLIFLLGLFAHLLPWWEARKLSFHLSQSLKHIQTTALQANTHICANFPKHFHLTIIKKSIWAADYKSIFECLKISFLSWFTWFINVPDEAHVSQRKLSQRQR